MSHSRCFPLSIIIRLVWEFVFNFSAYFIDICVWHVWRLSSYQHQNKTEKGFHSVLWLMEKFESDLSVNILNFDHSSKIAYHVEVNVKIFDCDHRRHFIDSNYFYSIMTGSVVCDRLIYGRSSDKVTGFYIQPYYCLR